MQWRGFESERDIEKIEWLDLGGEGKNNLSGLIHLETAVKQ